MIHFNQLYLNAQALSVFGGLKENEGVDALIGMTKLPQAEELARLWAIYYRALCENGCEKDSGGFFRRLALRNENVFSVRTAAGESTANLEETAAAELQILDTLSRIEPQDFYAAYGEDIRLFPKWERGNRRVPEVADLRRSVQTNGYGAFFDSVAYAYDVETKRIAALENVNPIRLSDLKEYEDCKRAVADNTLCFIEGLPANNVLLYGDRGTGKSSTVHAVLNEFSARGLRLLEVSKSAIPDFPVIFKRLEKLRCFRFILFIDDLTFVEGADNFAELKAALEGSVSRLDNVLIYATTNRRHLVKESHADRTGDVHLGDAIQEQMSLSDRFGLVVTYINPDKKEFLTILRKILADRNLTLGDDVLSRLAEQYALKKGGRSGRAAKQLADMIESRIKRGQDLEDMF